MAGHQNSPIAMSLHMKKNDNRSDRMPPIKMQERGTHKNEGWIQEWYQQRIKQDKPNQSRSKSEVTFSCHAAKGID